MLGFRGATILTLTLALAAFTFGCSSDGGGGAGGEGGIGGEIAANFETSLHKTREGKNFWYKASNNGMQTLIGIAYDDFSCKDCHNKKDPAWAGEATCADCHDSGGMGGAGGMALPKHLNPATCLGCHGRQGGEAGKLPPEGQDYHAQAGLTCQDCHGSNDVHGNGTEYDSMLRPGAIATRCDDCHTDGGPGKLPPDDDFHASAHAALDCALCHTETVISCLNCHVEEDLDNQDKCKAGAVFNWKFVMKWDKDGGDNEVYHPATLMTLKFACDRAGVPNDCPPTAPGGSDKSFAVFAPYYAHTVTQKAIDDIKAAGQGGLGTDGCGYCHGGAANCDTISDAGGVNPKQKLVEFEGTGGAGGMQTGKLTNPISGLIPLPADYRQRFEIDFVEYQAGPGNVDCADDEGKPIPLPLVYLETGPDMWQTGEDTTVPPTAEVGHPLDQDEMRKFCPGYTLLPAP